MSGAAPKLEDQARGYWVSSVIFRRRHVPAEFVEIFSVRGVLDLDDARETALATICEIGRQSIYPALRARVMREYPALLPLSVAP